MFLYYESARSLRMQSVKNETETHSTPISDKIILSYGLVFFSCLVLKRHHEECQTYLILSNLYYKIILKNLSYTASLHDTTIAFVLCIATRPPPKSSDLIANKIQHRQLKGSNRKNDQCAGSPVYGTTNHCGYMPPGN